MAYKNKNTVVFGMRWEKKTQKWNRKKNLLKILYRMINYQRDSESRVEYIDNK